MLKGLDPILSADLLWVLAAMGHGDDLAVVDANHPAQAMAAATVSGRLVRLPGLPIERVVRAILTVLPIDDFTADPVRRMEVVGDAAAVPVVQELVQREVSRATGSARAMSGIARFEFYEAEKRAFAVVQVGDPRPYGCFLIRKGVIAGESPA